MLNGVEVPVKKFADSIGTIDGVTGLTRLGFLDQCLLEKERSYSNENRIRAVKVERDCRGF
jgi:hypothetical protein